MMESTVYLSASLSSGGEQDYTIEMTRDGIGWKVRSVTPVYLSQDSASSTDDGADGSAATDGSAADASTGSDSAADASTGSAADSATASPETTE